MFKIASQQARTHHLCSITVKAKWHTAGMKWRRLDVVGCPILRYRSRQVFIVVPVVLEILGARNLNAPTASSFGRSSGQKPVKKGPFSEMPQVGKDLVRKHNAQLDQLHSRVWHCSVLNCAAKAPMHLNQPSVVRHQQPRTVSVNIQSRQVAFERAAWLDAILAFVPISRRCLPRPSHPVLQTLR